MSTTFPRPMPIAGVTEVDIAIQRVDYQAPEAGGYMGGVQAGFPLWTGAWTLGEMEVDRSDEWLTWRDSLRGAQRRFLSYDHSRPFPRKYPGGFGGMTRATGGAFDGSATSFQSFVFDSGEARVTLYGLPAGMVLSIRDCIGFRWDAGGSAAGTGDRRTMTRIIQADSVLPDGRVQVVVEPAVPATIVPTTAIAHLDAPACVMTMVPESTRINPVGLLGTTTGGTIVGVQDLRP